MVLVPDESVVEKLATTSPDPAFGDRVRAGRPDVAEHGPDPRISEDRVERGRVVRAAIEATATVTPFLDPLPDQTARGTWNPQNGRWTS
jgi:hypothetical protein